MVEGPFCLFQTVSQDAFCQEHTIPIDSLILFSESPAIVRLFGARRLSQQSHPFFPSPEKVRTCIYEGIPQVDCFWHRLSRLSYGQFET